MVQQSSDASRFEYAPGIRGKYLFRVREAYVAGSVAEMVGARRLGALKLDLILRGLALLPAHAPPNEPGFVPRHRGRLSYQALHDLCRQSTRYSLNFGDSSDDSPEVLEKKRTWVREQLQELEKRSLVRRQPGLRGRRPDIIVLSDRGDGAHYDDPTGSDGTYITLSGAVLSSDHFRRWGAPQLVGYLCAMTAEREARFRQQMHSEQAIPVGAGMWFRQVDWFTGTNPNFNRPSTHVTYPFSTMTIQRGLRALRDEGLIEAQRTTKNPETGKRFTSGPRMVYRNRFDRLNPASKSDMLD